MITALRNLVPSWSSTVLRDVTQRRSLRYSRTNQKNSNVPFGWLSMFMETSTWLNTHFRLSLSWPSRYSQVLWQHWDVGKCLNHASCSPWWNGRWLLWSWRWGSLLDQSGYQGLRQLSGKETPFYLLSSLTSYLLKNTSDLRYIRLMGEEHRPVMILMGVISQLWNASQLSWWEQGCLPNSLHRSNPHPVSNENMWTGRSNKNSVISGVPCWSARPFLEKCSSRSVLLKPWILTSTIVGDEMESRQCSSLWTETQTVSVDDFCSNYSCDVLTNHVSSSKIRNSNHVNVAF